MLSIEPRLILIPFDHLEENVSQSILICNTSSKKTRLAAQLPSSTAFEFSTLKRGDFYSGESTTLVINYKPKSWETIEDVFYITCHGLSDYIPIQIRGGCHSCSFSTSQGFKNSKAY